MFSFFFKKPKKPTGFAEPSLEELEDSICRINFRLRTIARLEMICSFYSPEEEKAYRKLRKFIEPYKLLLRRINDNLKDILEKRTKEEVLCRHRTICHVCKKEFNKVDVKSREGV